MKNSSKQVRPLEITKAENKAEEPTRDDFLILHSLFYNMYQSFVKHFTFNPKTSKQHYFLNKIWVVSLYHSIISLFQRSNNRAIKPIRHVGPCGSLQHKWYYSQHRLPANIKLYKCINIYKYNIIQIDHDMFKETHWCLQGQQKSCQFSSLGRFRFPNKCSIFTDELEVFFKPAFHYECYHLTACMMERWRMYRHCEHKNWSQLCQGLLKPVVYRVLNALQHKTPLTVIQDVLVFHSLKRVIWPKLLLHVHMVIEKTWLSIQSKLTSSFFRFSQNQKKLIRTWDCCHKAFV